MKGVIRCYGSYPCKHCKTRFKILPTKSGSWLPVEFINGVPPEDDEFNPEIHTSHLKNCKPRREDWDQIKWHLRKKETAKMFGDELTR
jgi:hypothetical protein